MNIDLKSIVGLAVMEHKEFIQDRDLHFFKVFHTVCKQIIEYEKNDVINWEEGREMRKQIPELFVFAVNQSIKATSNRLIKIMPKPKNLTEAIRLWQKENGLKKLASYPDQNMSALARKMYNDFKKMGINYKESGIRTTLCTLKNEEQ